jgi:hypothetical protein
MNSTLTTHACEGEVRRELKGKRTYDTRMKRYCNAIGSTAGDGQHLQMTRSAEHVFVQRMMCLIYYSTPSYRVRLYINEGG